MRIGQADCRTVAHQDTVEASHFYTGCARRVEDNAIVGGCCCPCEYYEQWEPHDAAATRRGRSPPCDARRQRPTRFSVQAQREGQPFMAGTGCAIVVVLAFVGYSWIGAWPSLGACEQLLHEYRDAETPASVLHVPLACSALRAKTHSEAPDAAQISTVVKNSASETLRRAQTERAVFDGPRVGTQAVTAPETQRRQRARARRSAPNNGAK